MTQALVAEHAAFSAPQDNEGGRESAANLPLLPRGSQMARRGSRVLIGLFSALHASRSRQAARVIARYRALDSRHQDLVVLPTTRESTP